MGNGGNAKAEVRGLPVIKRRIRGGLMAAAKNTNFLDDQKREERTMV